MTSLRIAAAFAALLFVVSTTQANDVFYAQFQGQSSHQDMASPDYGVATPQTRAAISSIPNVFGDETPVNPNADVAETASAQKADFIVLMGLGGLLLAGVAATTICLVQRKKASLNSKPARLVGV